MKIIIIGAGIAGLTLALACERFHIDYEIYEKAKRLENIGGGIILWPHGIRYLTWLGLDDLLEAFWVSVEGCNIVAENGNIIFSEKFATLNALLDGKALPLERAKLQEALLRALPTHKIHYQKTCVNVQEEPGKAVIYFADGTQTVGDLVVGADGVNSNIRKLCHPESKLIYTNYCWWGGVLEQHYLPTLARDHVYFSVGLAKVCVIWPLTQSRFMWYIPIKLAYNDFKNNPELLFQLCASWNNDINDLLSAPLPRQTFKVPIFTLNSIDSIAWGRCVLIGDAAHALGPILGQGASLAIEDVFVLVNRLIKNKLPIIEFLQVYQSTRLTRLQQFHELENKSAAAMVSEDATCLAQFQEELKHTNLVTMYQELIPLINEQASKKLWNEQSTQCVYPSDAIHY